MIKEIKAAFPRWELVSVSPTTHNGGNAVCAQYWVGADTVVSTLMAWDYATDRFAVLSYHRLGE